MKSYIIGIAGKKNSGKDTLASMLNYIVAVGTTSASFVDWATNKDRYDLQFKDRITHFADPMKDCLSIMYNIPREYFDDRVKKDEEWYCIAERRFISEKESINIKYIRVNIDDLDGHPLAYYLNTAPRNNKIVVIKLRTLMQYFATDIGRRQLGNNLWVNATIGKAADIAMGRKICIIPDMRFKNEWNAVTTHILYGRDIIIKRDIASSEEHDSEVIDFEPKYPIINNGTKLQLFYKAVGIVSHMLDPVNV